MSRTGDVRRPQGPSMSAYVAFRQVNPIPDLQSRHQQADGLGGAVGLSGDAADVLCRVVGGKALSAGPAEEGPEGGEPAVDGRGRQGGGERLAVVSHADGHDGSRLNLPPALAVGS